MSDITADDEGIEGKKPSKLPMIIGIVLALAGGGGGFFAVQSGLLGGAGGDVEHDSADAKHVEEDGIETASLPDVSFVEVPQLVISLGPKAQANHLRFRASLEVPKKIYC